MFVAIKGFMPLIVVPQLLTRLAAAELVRDAANFAELKITRGYGNINPAAVAKRRVLSLGRDKILDIISASYQGI